MYGSLEEFFTASSNVSQPRPSLFTSAMTSSLYPGGGYAADVAVAGQAQLGPGSDLDLTRQPLCLLQVFDVSDNGFTGSFPSELFSLGSLCKYNVCVTSAWLLIKLCLSTNVCEWVRQCVITLIVAENHWPCDFVATFGTRQRFSYYREKWFHAVLWIFLRNSLHLHLLIFIYTHSHLHTCFLWSVGFLEALAASSNCFSGELIVAEAPLPTSRLQTVSLSGLSSGQQCRRYIVSDKLVPHPGYVPLQYMSGTIPSYIWAFPNLTSLYLGGGGFSGPIDRSGTFSSDSKLQYVQLPYNQLTGTLPLSFQEYGRFQWVSFIHDNFIWKLSVCFTSCNLIYRF